MAPTYTVVVRMSVQLAFPVRALALQAWHVMRLLEVTDRRGDSRGPSLARHSCTYLATSWLVWEHVMHVFDRTAM